VAEVYRRVRGQKIQRFIATQPGVQAATRGQARAIAELAQGVLAEHVHFGHSRITMEHGDVDWYVVLNDERGQRAAIAIEYGRSEGAPNGPSKGVWALHLAAGLPLKRKK
jgi:hypothetical protein